MFNSFKGTLESLLSVPEGVEFLFIYAALCGVITLVMFFIVKIIHDRVDHTSLGARIRRAGVLPAMMGKDLGDRRNQCRRLEDRRHQYRRSEDKILIQKDSNITKEVATSTS